MNHRCPECGGWWKCKSCTEELIKEGICSREKLCCKCRQTDQSCDCDNCEYIRRFGITRNQWNTYGMDTAKCKLCNNYMPEHNGWKCPEKTEWELPCGAKVMHLSKDYIEIESPNRYRVFHLPSLRKILQEIEKREK